MLSSHSFPPPRGADPLLQPPHRPPRNRAGLRRALAALGLRQPARPAGPPRTDQTPALLALVRPPHGPAGLAAANRPVLRDYQLDPAEFADPPESFGSFNEFFYRSLDRRRPPDRSRSRLGRLPRRRPPSRLPPRRPDRLGVRQGPALRPAPPARRRRPRRALRRRPAGPLPPLPGRLPPLPLPRRRHPGNPALIDGPLFSVSPIALRRRLSCLWENKRGLTRLESPASAPC